MMGMDTTFTMALLATMSILFILKNNRNHLLEVLLGAFFLISYTSAAAVGAATKEECLPHVDSNQNQKKMIMTKKKSLNKTNQINNNNKQSQKRQR